MNDPIPEPLRGADVISWAHPVTRALNALHDKIGAPTRNERDRRASSPDMGCWKIVRKTRDDEGEMLPAPVRVFENQFYRMGGVVKELELEDTVEDFVCQGDLEEGEEYTDGDRPFVALKVPATTDSTDEPTLAGFADVEELHAAQADTAYVVKPLYKFTHDGSVAVDFRNCPTLQVEEML